MPPKKTINPTNFSPSLQFMHPSTNHLLSTSLQWLLPLSSPSLHYNHLRMVAGASTSSPTPLLLPLLLSLLLHRTTAHSNPPPFREAPKFRNGETCSSSAAAIIHVAMTLDGSYLRGTAAAVLSILEHCTCPENLSFHFIWARPDPLVSATMRSTFPDLQLNLYRLDTARVGGLISKSIRQALDQPLNYARIYLAQTLPKAVERLIYLDSDVVVVDDLSELWSTQLKGKALAAPEYCHANFSSYFTTAFWWSQSLS